MSLARSAAAVAVHAYTASGALLGWLALRSAWDHDPRTAFLWLSLAVFVDATDGFAARAVDVRRHAPWIDGARLDDIVDYVTFVVVPGVLVWRLDLLPSAAAPWVVGATLVASALGFARRDAKTDDHLFTGFLSYWNIVAVYLIALRSAPPVAAGFLLVLAALVFVPIRYVYPSRTVTLRPLTLALGAAWAAACVVLIWQFPDPPRWLAWATSIYPVYYVALSLWLTVRRGRA